MVAPVRSLEEELAAALRAGRSVAPTATLTIRLRDGVSVDVPPEPPKTELPGAPLSESDLHILRSIGPDKCLTAQDIAERAERANEGRFRGQLGRLRRVGYLTGEEGEPGYGLTEAGRAAIA